MKIGLIGYGKMGQAIEAIAQERGHEVVVKLTSKSPPEAWSALKQADVAIEFTRPESALSNFKKCFENGIPLVTGTTGWYDHKEEVRQACEHQRGSFFWASNFSIGVNLFWEMNRKLAQLMSQHSDYDVSMREIHHTQKLDEPSGTAITTAEQIIPHYPELTRWKLASEHPSDSDLSITSLREGDVKGTHIVTYESEIDRIELKHEAKTRRGFALGAVLASEFLKGKHGFYTMADLLA